MSGRPPLSAHDVSATLHTVALTLQCLERRGLPSHEALAHTGITDTMLNQPAGLITLAQEFMVLAKARELYGDDSVGLDVGAAMHLSSYGMLGFAMMISPTLAHAFQCTLQFRVLLCSYFQQTLQIKDDLMWFTISDYAYRPDLALIGSDLCMASYWTMVRDVIGARVSPVVLQFSHAQPRHRQRYVDFFGCEPVFNAPATRFAFPKFWLDKPLPYAEPVSFHMALQQCEQLEREMARSAGDSVIARVLRLIYADPARYSHLDAVAQELGLTSRTLRRRLLLGHTKFQSLLDQALRDRALDYLQKTQLNIADIALRLGYSEPASFRLAFKRWTQKSPSDFRKPTQPIAYPELA